ncbi:hypothetical protein C8T65DRAFT_741030 [Cerioporus squamosus]|nr:hypothetical protein C8T65DRAFT_741030 [Cerioporus squamosus]
MSSYAGPDAAAQIIAVYQALFISTACAYATLTLVFYEYAITLGQEVLIFWKRRFTGATALFLLNRYLLVLSSTLIVVGETVSSEMVFLLGLVPYGINMLQYGKGLTGIMDPIVGCATVTPGLSQELETARLTIVSRTTQIAFDLLLIGITWWSLLKHVHGMRTTSFTAVFVRHGMIYFIVMLVLNTLHLALTLVSIGVAPSTPASSVTIFTLPLTAILVSRFLLDLQHANSEAVHICSGSEDASHESTDTAHATSSINFERVVGSIGSTMSAGFLAQSEDGSLEESTSRMMSNGTELGGLEKCLPATGGGRQWRGAVLPVAMDRRDPAPPHN